MPEFDGEYQAVLAGEAVKRTKRAAVGTPQWLWERYRATTAATELI
jgi:hypothetical protein